MEAPSGLAALAPQDDAEMSGWTYMLRCSDQSYYVGSTSYQDFQTRVDEHNDAKFIGYTSSRRPVVLVWSKRFDDLRDAHDAERRIKGWGRAKKKALIASDAAGLKQLSKRRAGKPKKDPRPSKRALVHSFHSSGSRHPEARAQRAPKDAR
jgi:putative endonuclease